MIIPESREHNRELRELIYALDCRVALETPISGVMQMVVPAGREVFFAEIMRQMPGVKWAGLEPVGSGGFSGCNSTGGVMTEPYDYPGPDSGNDADFDQQWYLENTGQTIINGNAPLTTGTPDPLNTSGGTAGVDIHIRDAWAITQGCEDIVVAVFDSGVQYEHRAFDYDRFFFPDLALTCTDATLTDPYPCCPSSPSSESPCANGYAIDTGGHGTPVAGVLGSQGNNQNASSGLTYGLPEISGVDLNCRILSVRVTAGEYHVVTPTSGVDFTFSAVATLAGLETIFYSSTYEDVRVINMSYQWACNLVPSHPIWGLVQDAIDALKDNGVVVVCISSNDGDGKADVYCPAKWSNVITVAGVNNVGGRWDDIVYGVTGKSGSGYSVDIAAPARAIFTSLCDANLSWWASPPLGHPPESPCVTIGPPQNGSGTSAAAPQVSGVIALLAARADELSVPWSFDLCYELLTNSATPMPPGSPDNTPNQIYGYGLINAYAALRQLEIIHYRPTHRADLTDHNNEGEWRFGIADGVTDCDDLAYFLDYAYPEQILEKADFTTTGTTTGQPGYGVPDGVVNTSDYNYYTTVLFPAAHPGGCS